MIEFTSINFRTWAKLGQRGAFFGVAVFDIAEQYPKLMIVTADLGFLSGLERFMNQHPQKFVNVGIAEQNMIGVSAGLADEGHIVFATTYATFITMRSCEQVRHYLGYMQSNVKIVGSGAGLVMGFSGNTHYTIEDLSMVRAIPNITILSPADATESVKIALAAANHNGPVYVRLTGELNNPMVYKEDYPFEIGKAVVLRPLGNVTVFATGSMVYNAIKAAEILEAKGILVRVVNIHTIKPIDEAAIMESTQISKLLVSVEEHSKIGGLGAVVAECITQFGVAVPLLRLGIDDAFKHCGNYKYNLEQNGLLPEQLASAIENRYIAL
ncbi:MAG TPA: transketolase [Marinilabiliales bacterium]|nr:MAG: transketolase [Bacteroidetes bacterium GWD2_40_43]OFX89646.1 MAG: transketolase [Bacteroidetes bacterium GWE2_40_63]OFY24164.1 MAG: transketolase [Bacteroidetes bacterium GWF2_40_13]OFZ26356.1 MAG: transketolase [Bacteroidetes bacterium RIFOXYC2_FULL_40_12]HAM99586.1 transketolase [Marinilabiliales bacterium]